MVKKFAGYNKMVKMTLAISMATALGIFVFQYRNAVKYEEKKEAISTHKSKK